MCVDERLAYLLIMTCMTFHYCICSPEFKHLPRRIHIEKTKETLTFTVKFDQSLDLSRVDKNLCCQVFLKIVIYLWRYFYNVQRIFYFLGQECRNRCDDIALPGLSCFRVLVELDIKLIFVV